MVKDNHRLVNLDFEGSSSYFVIAITALMVALLLSCCCRGMGCSPRAWRKRQIQTELSNHLQRTMELAEDYKVKLGQKALELKMEEGSVSAQPTVSTSTAIGACTPTGPTGSTLGGQYQ